MKAMQSRKKRVHLQKKILLMFFKFAALRVDFGQTVWEWSREGLPRVFFLSFWSFIGTAHWLWYLEVSVSVLWSWDASQCPESSTASWCHTPPPGSRLGRPSYNPSPHAGQLPSEAEQRTEQRMKDTTICAEVDNSALYWQNLPRY